MIAVALRLSFLSFFEVSARSEPSLLNTNLSIFFNVSAFQVPGVRSIRPDLEAPAPGLAPAAGLAGVAGALASAAPGFASEAAPGFSLAFGAGFFGTSFQVDLYAMNGIPVVPTEKESIFGNFLIVIEVTSITASVSLD